MVVIFLILRFLVVALLASSSTSSAQPATAQNVSSGATLVAGDSHAASWPSPTGDFAFGFVPAPANATLFLLAVFFPKTANITIVWTANGDRPVSAGSKVQLTRDGFLTLTNATGGNSLIAGGGKASTASMLDSGNFVLYAADSTYVWDTFSHPTDTLLPSQVIGQGVTVRSRLTADDYSVGLYALGVQYDGNLIIAQAFLPTRYYLDDSSYYYSNTFGEGSSLVYNATTSAIYMTLNNASDPPVDLTSNPVPSAGSYQRATLDPDGVLRLYSYPMNSTGAAAAWTVANYTPSDICIAAMMGVTKGSGACGLNSYCKLLVGTGGVAAPAKPGERQCICLPNFSFVDQNIKQLGCVADFPQQRCDVDETGMYELTELANTDFFSFDYSVNEPMSEDECRAACLADCTCSAAVLSISSDSPTCWMKKFPLSNGVMNSTRLNNRKAFVKVLKPGVNPSPPGEGAPQHGNRDRKWILVGVLPSAASVVLFVASAFMLFYNGRIVGRRSARASVAPIPGTNLQSFSYAELDRATNKFRKQIGKGGFGTVYEGFLGLAGGGGVNTRIAVKKLHKPPEESEREFMAEVGSIGKAHHKNLVWLVGFCNEGNERLLVYEYVSNGSLTNHLFGGGEGGTATAKMSWEKRVDIAVGIARGLLYLHEECDTQIVHCDIKSQNVLLDDNFAAKISDFGMAKLLRHDQTRTETLIRGTRGYVAPEWFKATAVTARVDVYSFGVLLLEIVCCRKNLEPEPVSEEQAVLVDWAYDCYRAGRLKDLLSIAGDDVDAEAPPLEMDSVERMVRVALWCVQEDPARRPTMRAVNQMLDGAAIVPVPPDPSSHQEFREVFDCELFSG